MANIILQCGTAVFYKWQVFYSFLKEGLLIMHYTSETVRDVSPTLGDSAGCPPPQCVFPLTPQNENIQQNGVMRIAKGFIGLFWSDLGIFVYKAPEMALHFLDLEKLSLTFLESSVFLSILCVGFDEILVCFQLSLFPLTSDFQTSAKLSVSLVKNSTGK